MIVDSISVFSYSKYIRTFANYEVDFINQHISHLSCIRSIAFIRSEYLPPDTGISLVVDFSDGRTALIQRKRCNVQLTFNFE